MALSYFSDPFTPFKEFDRLFDEAFTGRAEDNTQVRRQGRQPGTPKLLRPRMDVHEDAQTNVVTATFELPGLKKEDVSIDVHDNALTVSGESKTAEEREEHGYKVRERRYGKFSRSIPLPQGINAEEIKASMENGVLSVTFPKVSPEQAPKKITIL